MKTNNPKALNAKNKCENYLKNQKKYNIAHEILPSQNTIIDLLLSNSIEMNTTYEELVTVYSKQQYELVLNIILSSAAHWNPNAAKKYREERNDLKDINIEIHKKAFELAKALKKREELNNKSGFSSDTQYSICDVIDKSSNNNGHYRSFLRKEINSLACQYDTKYWPSLSDIVNEISEDAMDPEIQAIDPLTKAATDSQRPSKSDFLKALLASLYENSYRGSDFGLPKGAKISDSSLATLINCVLKLGADDIVDSVYVKGVRQRLRKDKGKGCHVV